MKKTPDWKLLAKYLSGESGTSESRLVEKWLITDPENQRLFDLMKTSWETKEDFTFSSDLDLQWEKLSQKIENAESANFIITKKPAHPGFYWPPVYRYAAILVILITLALFFSKNLLFINSDSADKSLESLFIKNGTMQTLSLSDGTVITLDAGSRLSYPKSFRGETREIMLEGEGFFEISPDPNHPFIIHTGIADIKVLGTKFNVRSWKAENEVTVAVKEGKVAFGEATDSSGSAVLLTSGQFSVLGEGRQPEVLQIDEYDKFLSWMHKEVYFENTPLPEILFQLERWYDVKFQITNNEIKNNHLDIHINNQDIDDVLELISILTDTRYTFNGNVVTIQSH